MTFTINILIVITFIIISVLVDLSFFLRPGIVSMRNCIVIALVKTNTDLESICLYFLLIISSAIIEISG